MQISEKEKGIRSIFANLKGLVFPYEWKKAAYILAVFIVAKLIVFGTILWGQTSLLLPNGEKLHTYWQWAGPEVTLSFNAPVTSIAFTALSNVNANIDVYFDGRLVDTLALNNEWKTYTISSEQAGNAVEIRADTYGVPREQNPESSDTRKISYGFQKLYINNDFSQNAIRLLGLPMEQQGLYHLEMSKSAGSGIIAMLKQGMINWDARWYTNLVETGYHWNGDSTAEQNAAISFMFPLMSLIFKWVFRTSSWAAVAGTNMLCSYFVLLLLYRLSMIITDGDTYKADLAVTLLAFAPGNIYMTAGLLEGALLLWIVLGLLFLERKQYLGFAFCMGCAVGVNTTAVFGAVVLVLDYWFINRHKATLKNVGRFIGYGVLTVWGILAQMMYFAYKFSDPFAMFKAQTAWRNGVVGNKSFNIKGIIRLLAIPITNFSELLYNDDYIVSLFFLAIAAFVIVLAVKTKFKLSRLDWLDMLFVLGAMSVVLLTSLQPDHVSRHAVRCALIIPLFLKHVRNDVLKKVSHLSVAVCVYFSFITAVQFSYHME